MSNQIALDFIKRFESCRLAAYQDQGGRWTIGWGATGPHIVQGTQWTQGEADLDLANRVDVLDRGVTLMTSPIGLPERSQAALISFAYNLGNGRLLASPIADYVRARNWISAARAFLPYDHESGIENRGLLRRRLEEAAMLLEGVA